MISATHGICSMCECCCFIRRIKYTYIHTHSYSYNKENSTRLTNYMSQYFSVKTVTRHS